MVILIASATAPLWTSLQPPLTVDEVLFSAERQTSLLDEIFGNFMLAFWVCFLSVWATLFVMFRAEE